MQKSTTKQKMQLYSVPFGIATKQTAFLSNQQFN